MKGIPPDWLEDFEAAAKRPLKTPRSACRFLAGDDFRDALARHQVRYLVNRYRD